jgi:hypothetical protein
MALVNVTKHIGNDPKSIGAINTAFSLVEHVSDGPLYKTLRVKGQGVPDSDTFISIKLGSDLQGNTRVLGWQLADPITGL